MPSQTLKKKDLYVGKCLGDLSKLSEVKVDTNNVSIIIRSANVLFENAEMFEKAGDEEKAYVLFLKYFSTLKVIKSKAEYKKQKDYFDNLIGRKNQITAIEKAEKLAESLKERYDLKEAEAVAKKLSDIDLKEKATPVVQVEEKEIPKAEEKPAASTPGLITSMKLCELLRDNNTKVILMDVRPERDYIQSHVSFTECINVPEEILVPGSTVTHIQAKLPSESKLQWSQRMHADFIVLIDWQSTLDDVKVGTPLQTLKDALFKFDLNTIIKSEPLVLQGGYEQWLLFYPTMTTNAHVKKPSDANSVKPPSPTFTLDFDYPDLDDNLQHKTTSVNSTTSKETVSESNGNVSSAPSVLAPSVPTPSVPTPSVPTPSVPRVDRSLKPSSSKDSLVLVNDTPSSVRKKTENNSAIPVAGLNNTIPKVDSNPNSLGSVKITNIVNDNFAAHGSKLNNWSLKNNLASDLSASVEIRQEKESELKNWQHAKAAALSEHQEKLKELEQKLLALDKIKKKEEKDVADLMRMKKRLREELDEEKKKQDEEIQNFNREGKKKLLAFELAKKEEQEKKLRLEEVEKLRQDRKKDEKLRDLEKRLEMEEEQKRAAVEALRLKLEEEEELEFEKRMQEMKWAKEFEKKKEAEMRQEEELRVTQQRQTEADESKRIQEELMRLKMEEEEKKAREREALEKRAIEAQREREALERKALEAQREKEALEKKAIEAQREREAKEKALREKELREQAERVMREREAAAKKLEEAERERIMKIKQEEAERERIMKIKQEEAERERIMKIKQEEAERERIVKIKMEEAERERIMKAKELEIQKSIKATGMPASKAVPTTNLPTGWEKRLDRTTNRYYYIDHNKGKTQWTPPAPPVPTFTKTIEKLKDEPSVSSSRGLSRSYSSPDIKKMMDDEEASVTVTQPSFNRNNKPSTVISKPMPPRSAYSVRKRDLNPVYGSVGPALTGLRNLGNTCYMNSTIQCLNNTSPLIGYFLDESYLYDINRESSQGMQGEVVDEFAVVVRALWSGEYRSITPRDLKSTIGKYNSIFAGYQQQDSQEFLTFLLDGLNEGLNEVKKAPEIPEQNNDNLSDAEAAAIAWKHHKLLSKSIIVELFQGQLKSSLTCRTCHKKSVTFQVFMSLSVPIPASSKCTLMDCLREFLKPELMTGNCKWKCPRCNVEREAEKKIDLWKLPPILLIGLNRFYADGMWMQKKTTYVDFPVTGLDLSQVVIGPLPKHSYELYGISNHYGTMEGGHYTAFCKNPVNKKWYKFDDQDVYEISSSDVKSSAAFVLYYTSVNMPIPVYKPHL